MATKNPRNQAPAKVAAAAPVAMTWEWAADFNRQQIAAGSDGACALFRGFEVIRRIQEQAAHAAAERHAHAAKQLRSPASPGDLALLQADVLGENLASAARYWQELAGATLEMDVEILAVAVQMVNAENVLAVTSPRFLHS
jgi:hypothetical protein